MKGNFKNQPKNNATGPNGTSRFFMAELSH